MNDDNYNYILNGRVNLYDNSHSQKTNKIPNNHPALYDPKNLETISRVYSGTHISELFFSRNNIDNIQEGIINNVYNISNGEYKIGKQNEQELSIVMRSIYLEKSKNLVNESYNVS